MWYERDLDALMARTANRPLPAGRVAPDDALGLGVLLSIFSVLLMAVSTNFVAAALLAAAILFYVFIYTVWLKPYAAEHRDRRRRRRLPADDRLGRRHRRRLGHLDRPVRTDLPVDAAALLGARPLSQRRLPPRRRAHAAGGGGPARDQAADADLHPGAAAGGAGADLDGRGRLALRRRRPGARPRLHRPRRHGVGAADDATGHGPARRMFRFSPIYLAALFAALPVDQLVSRMLAG